MSRLKKLRQTLTNKELDVLVVSQPENRRYLSGFTGSAGWLLISDRDTYLAVDFRYVEQAKNEAPNFDVVLVKGDIIRWLPEFISGLGWHRAGFEADHVSCTTYQQLCKVVGVDDYHIQFVPTNSMVESIRAVKEPEELEFIIEAVKLADAAFEHAKSILRPGMTEREVAWGLEKFLREKGSEALPFDIIVASGTNAALPHAKPSERLIMKNTPIVIDLGARVKGYCSDLSRTFFLGDEDKTFSKIYDIVLGAQLAAIETIQAGMNGGQADCLARKVIEQANYGDSFGHGLGHGVGLGAHESPRLGPSSSDLLIDSMVFTIEPGIYIADWGGVRIEDTVVMANGKIMTLAGADKTANIY